VTVVAPTEGADAPGSRDDGPEEAAGPDGAGAAALPSVPQQATGWSPRRFALLLGLALLAGLALRVAIGLTDDAPPTDETAYLRSGLALADGDGFTRDGEPELHFPPFVPFLLGSASHVVDDPHTGTVIITVIAGTLAILPLALIARHIAGDRAAVATAWVAAFAPGLATLPVNRGAGSESEYVLLAATGVWLVVSSAGKGTRSRLARLVGAGICIGFAYLTRPEGLFMAVPLGLGVLVVAAGGWKALRTGPGLGRAVTAGAAFALPLVACIVPYAMYLHDNTGKWELTAKTQDSSIEAWHAVARGDRETRDSVLYALDDSGLQFDTSRKSLTALAREDPGGYLGIFWTNAGNLLGVFAAPIAGQTLAWALLPLPLTLLALYAGWQYRRSRAVVLLAAVAAMPMITGLMFFVQHRYLVVTTAALVVLAGIGLAAVPMPTRWRQVAGGLAAVLLALSTVQAFRGPGGWWHPADHADQRHAGEWLAANTDDDAVVMSRSMVVQYYADRDTLAIPYADLDTILDFGRHYGVQYLVVDTFTTTRLRPQLAGLAELEDGDAVPGLRLVHDTRADGRTTRIFALDPVPPPPTEGEEGPKLGFVGDGS
jgi:hypothetical protein